MEAALLLMHSFNVPVEDLLLRKNLAATRTRRDFVIIFLLVPELGPRLAERLASLPQALRVI